MTQSSGLASLLGFTRRRVPVLRGLASVFALMLLLADASVAQVCSAGTMSGTYTTDQTLTVAAGDWELGLTGVGATGGGNDSDRRGGTGATVAATFRVGGGTSLQVYVGQGGMTDYGGGGGTGVIANGNTLLLIAGGGGGASSYGSNGQGGSTAFSEPGGGSGLSYFGGGGGGGFGGGNDGVDGGSDGGGGGQAATLSGKGSGGSGRGRGGDGFGGGGGGGYQGGGGGGGYRGGNGGFGGGGGGGGAGGTSYVNTASFAGVFDPFASSDGTSGGGTTGDGANGSVSFSCTPYVPDVMLTANTPGNGEVGVTRDGNVAASFSETLSAGSVNTASFAVRGSQSGRRAGAYSVAGSSVTFDPARDFLPGERVLVEASELIQGTSGSTLDPYAWSFLAASGEGAGTYDAATPIATLSSASESHPVDIDADGDVDVVILEDGAVRLYTNDGSGTFTSSDLLSGLVNAYRLAVADLDGDGDLDLILGFYGSSVRWYENTGGSYTQHDVGSSSAGNASKILVADIDGNGALDIVGVANGVYWFRNDGSETFSYYVAGAGSQGVDVADMDGDGDLDLLSAIAYSDQVYLLTNDGRGVFTTTVLTSTAAEADGPVDVAAADMNGDGDLDLVVAAQSENQVVWFAGNGDGTFGPRQAVGGGYSNPSRITPADLDGDGDLDVAVGYRGNFSFDGDGAVVWYENDGSPSFTARAVKTGADDVFDLAPADLTGDGVLDLLSVEAETGVLSYFTQEEAAPVPLVVTTTNDSGAGSLRQAVADVADGGTITFAAGLSGQTITLTSGVITTTKSVTIDGSSLAEQVTISGNDASQILYTPPAPFPGPTITFDSVTLANGRAEEENGGTVHVYNGSLYLENTTVRDSWARYEGGGVRVGGGVLVVNRSTLSGNTTGGSYGAAASSNSGSMTVSNSTVSGNPGTYVLYSQDSITLTNVTLADNGAGPLIQNLGADGELRMTNVLMSESEDCVVTSGATLVSQNTFVDNGSCSATYSGDARLGPLADNGGSTLTHRLLSASPAIDRGDASACASLPGGNVDQRGAARVGTCDIGAVEYNEQAASVTGDDGWRMLTLPRGGTVDALVGSFWTQGFPGADYGGGNANVYIYDESEAGDADFGYRTPTSQSEDRARGTGVFVYVYEDDVYGDAVDGGFPKLLTQPFPEPSTSAFTWSAAGDGPLSYTDTPAPAADDGWNLLGNPYATFLDWDDVGLTAVDDAVYVWSDADGQYRTYSEGSGGLTGGLVEPFSGFWVHATGAGRSLTASPAAPRTASAERLEVALRLSPGDGSALPATLASDAFVVVGTPGADDGVDGIDAYALSPLADAFVQLASFVPEADADGLVGLSVDHRPSRGQRVEADLDVRAVLGGEAVGSPLVLTWPTFDAASLPAGVRVALVDRQTGTEVDLRDADRYAFTLDGADGETLARTSEPLSLLAPSPLRRPLSEHGRTASSRFALIVEGYAATETEADVPAVATLGAPAPNPTRGLSTLRLAVPSPERVRAVVVDALGRTVAVAYDGEVAGSAMLTVDTSRLSPGVYVVRVEGATFAASRSLTVVR